MYDKIIELIINNRIKTEDAEYSYNSLKSLSPLPTVYYIGMGKVGCTSMMKGFINNYTALFHGKSSFEKIYSTNLLSTNNIDIYDIITYIGNKYNFKPLIIECIRDPISQNVSKYFQHLKFNRNCTCDLCQWKLYDKNIKNLLPIIKNRINYDSWNKSIQSIPMWKKHFNINLLDLFKNKKYIFYETNNTKLLFLRYEEINDRQNILNNINYDFVDKKLNITNSHCENNLNYDYIKKHLKFTKEEFNNIFKLNAKILYYDKLKFFEDKYVV